MRLQRSGPGILLLVGLASCRGSDNVTIPSSFDQTLLRVHACCYTSMGAAIGTHTSVPKSQSVLATRPISTTIPSTSTLRSSSVRRSI